MTREAKVGLLLGLVFIVAIAVVLSDVHQNSTNYVDETLALSEVEEGTPDKAVSEGVNLSVAVKQLSPQEPLVQVSSPKPGIPSPMALTEEPAPLGPPMSFPVRSDEPVIRYESFLPSSARPGMVVTNEPVKTQEPMVIPEPLPTIVPPSGEVERAVDAVVTQEIPSAIQFAGNLVTPPAKESKVYVVSKGDDLSKIARKVYGEKEGNRWVNINKIYEANSRAMGSRDNLQIGQQLVIPEIASTETNGPGGQASNPVRSEKKESRKGRVYEVKEGDTLWKIAAKQLGNGVRYQEIVEINKDVFQKAGGPDKLRTGMKLHLPE